MTETASPRRFATLRRVLAPERLHPRQIGPGLLRAWRWLRASVLWKHWLLIFAVVGLSVSSGYATAIFEQNALYIAVGLLLSAFILIDFRVGAMALIIMMPISGSNIFPHELLGIKGLNPINLVLLSTLFSYGARRMFVGSNYKFFPRELVWFYILPILLAGVYGSGHVGEIPSFLLADASFDDKSGYIRDMVIKPMLLVVFSGFVGAAIYDGLNPRHVLLTVLVSIWIMSFMVIIYFLLSGAHVGELADSKSRGFLSPLGMHPNDLGRLYATAYAMLLFSLRGAPQGFIRLLILLSIGLVGVALMLTFSRAAFVAFIVITMVYLAMLRSFKALGAGMLVAILVAISLPGAIYQRAGLGFGPDANASDITAARSDLIWQPLLPEILKSPVIGGGLGSTMWSDPMLAGTMLPVGHPHNAYIKVLLDMGIAGFALLTAFYWRGWKVFRRLTGDRDIDPLLRHFFEGASVGLATYLLVGLSGSSLDPAPEQSFIWLALGMAFGVLANANRIQLKANPCAA